MINIQFVWQNANHKRICDFNSTMSNHRNSNMALCFISLFLEFLLFYERIITTSHHHSIIQYLCYVFALVGPRPTSVSGTNACIQWKQRMLPCDWRYYRFVVINKTYYALKLHIRIAFMRSTLSTPVNVHKCVLFVGRWT